MLLVRKVGSWGAWASNEPSNLERALRDFGLREGEAYLSIYRVESKKDAERLIVLHALAYTTKDVHTDYVLFEEEELDEALSLHHEPDGIPEAALREALPGDVVDTLKERHFGLHERQEGALRELARRLLEAADYRPGRVNKSVIGEARQRLRKG